MENLKAFWAKAVAVWGKAVAAFDYVASYVADYPKIALGVILALATLAVFC